MHLFFPSQKRGDLFYISGEEHRHLKVRRVCPGEEIGVIHGGKIYRCVLRERGRDRSVAEAVGVLDTTRPAVELTLYQSVTHSLSTMDLIVQKAVELGVARFVPLLTARSFRNVPAVEKRRERWERIVREAMKQSGRAYTMELCSPCRLEDAEPLCELNLLLDSFSGEKGMGELSFRGVRSVSLVVGPEGGFTEAEGSALRRKGFTPIRLKPHILRTETAAVAAVSIIVNLADL